jgi:3-oxo-4-pregnene-20-carboxyl-CoA dehydrogenase alpha subunit
VNNELADEAIEFGALVTRALEAAGGDVLLQTAEQAPQRRAELVVPVLAPLGVWDLDLSSGGDELEAAALACRAAGYWAAPYPVAERLARTASSGALGLIVVADQQPSGSVSGIEGSWATTTLGGDRGIAVARPPLDSPRKSAFVASLDIVPVPGSAPATDVALGLLLPCWTLLGMLDRALAVTRSYVVERKQFGQPLASFQSVQFQLTDAELERIGVEELAKYALWSLRARPADAVADSLAVRLAAIEAAETVFRVAHQLHGAIGFCDETVVSWLSRVSQPLRRLPTGLSATREALTRSTGRRGLSGLFDDISL